jgi:Universal stress protein family
MVFPEPEELEKENMKMLHALDKKLKAKYGKIETEVWNEPGFVVDEITRFTQKHKIDLVIMGVTGAGKSPGILGSNTTSVMHRITSPVLVIPKGCQFRKPSTIALACDYKSIPSDETIDKFKYFAHLFNSKVLLFNIVKKNELASYQKTVTEVNLENMLTDVEHSLHFPSGDNLPKEINKFIDKHRVDMLVMFPHHYNLIEGLFHHSASKELAFLSRVPLLSIYE